MTAKEFPLVAQNDLEPVEERIKRFSNLLDTLESLSDKKKALWKEIYANAIIDRNHALMCYNDLMMNVIGKQNTAEHAIHAQNLAKYMERMSKANDQLLKLAELIADAEKKDEQINPEEIYRQINGD